MKKINKAQEGIPLLEELLFTPTDLEFLELTEEDKAEGVKRVRLTVIKAGLSMNLNFYKPEVLEKLPSFIEEHPKMYLDHSIFGGYLSRSMREWAATITKVWYHGESTSVKAEARMTANPDTVWLYKEMKADPKDIGCSIDARVMAHEEEIDVGGTKVNARVIDSWVYLNSVDFVTYAAAGGGIERVAASENSADIFQLIVKAAVEVANQKNNTNKEGTSMTLEELKKEHPDLVKAILEEAAKASEGKGLEKKVADLEAEKKALTDSNMGLKAGSDTAAEKIKTLEGELTSAKAKLDAFETKERQAAHKAAIDAKLAEVVKAGNLKEAQVTQKFKDLLYEITEMAKVEVLIAERVEALSPLGVDDNGRRKTESATQQKPTMTGDLLAASIKARN